MNYIHYKLILVLSLPFWACHCDSRNQVQQTTKEVYPFKKINAYVRYMQQNRELQAKMTFKTDSSVAIEGSVLVNKKPMQAKNLPTVGLQYRLLENAVSFDSSYTFEFKQKGGSSQTFNIEMNRFENPEIMGQQISQKNGGVLQWKGAALEKEDGLILIFTDSEGQTFSVNHNGISRGNKFELVANYSKRLSKGPAQLLITRKTTTQNQIDNCSNLLCLEYYHRPITFNVTN